MVNKRSDGLMAKKLHLSFIAAAVRPLLHGWHAIIDILSPLIYALNKNHYCPTKELFETDWTEGLSMNFPLEKLDSLIWAVLELS